LEERIDIKLLQTGKLDFVQFKKIMIRLNRANDALLGLGRIELYISNYKDLCKEKKLEREANHAKLFTDILLDPAKDSIKSDA